MTIPIYFSSDLSDRFLSEAVEADNFDSVNRALAAFRPTVVVNCIGIIKQLPVSNDALITIGINALFPHRLSLSCRLLGARLIQISTDCVFNGIKGNYSEEDSPTAEDLYGRTKLLGEVYYPHCITLRTSIIGHELKGNYGLIEWFLGQTSRVKGFQKSIFSGFPTVEFARIISDYVIPNPQLNGLYHISSSPISKFDLITMVAATYGKQIEIEPSEALIQNRSLRSDRFQALTGYSSPSWPDLVEAMYKDYGNNQEQYNRG